MDNIATINGRASIAYQGATPWHKLGQRMKGDVTVDEALIAAGLDFDVVAEALTLQLSDGNLYTVPDRKGLIRADSDGQRSYLATVGSDYEIIGNRAATEIMRPLIDMGCSINALGALDNGRRCWMLASMGKTVSPVDGDDVKGYALLDWSHDGQTRLQLIGTMIRVVCQNTLNMAIAAHGKRAAWVAIKHSSSAPARIDEAARIMVKLSEAIAKTGDTFASLAKLNLDANALRAYIARVLPAEDESKVPAKLAARRETIEQLAYTGKGAEMASQAVPDVSAWAAYNAITEYFDHVRPAEATNASGVQRANVSALFGGNADAKAFALTQAQQLLTA